MFGYVTINKPELKIKDFEIYRGYYCGLCHSLRENYGLKGQLTLTYDMTFLALLLSSLYEADMEETQHRCMLHPLEKRNIIQTKYTDYVADIIILAKWKALDDWQDERKILSLAFSKLLKSKPEYKDKSDSIRALLKQITTLEKQGETNIDIMAGIFGNITRTVFSPQNDMWKESLQKMGFFLGKFIYILDAYDDLEKDIRQNLYNPLKSVCTNPGFDDKIHSGLTMMMAECCSEFEMLPILRHADILRNILYAGVFCSYYRIRKHREEISKNEL